MGNDSPPGFGLISGSQDFVSAVEWMRQHLDRLVSTVRPHMRRADKKFLRHSTLMGAIFGAVDRPHAIRCQLSSP